MTYARAASHGFGLGQTEARRYVSELSPQDAETLHAELAGQVDFTWALAQNHPVPFGEYVSELPADGRADQGELERVYRAGFDIAFSAFLVESLNAATAAVIDANQAAPDTGASIEGARIAQ